MQLERTLRVAHLARQVQSIEECAHHRAHGSGGGGGGGGVKRDCTHSDCPEKHAKEPNVVVGPFFDEREGFDPKYTYPRWQAEKIMKALVRHYPQEMTKEVYEAGLAYMMGHSLRHENFNNEVREWWDWMAERGWLPLPTEPFKPYIIYDAYGRLMGTYFNMRRRGWFA